jgi:hypothetical protein
MFLFCTVRSHEKAMKKLLVLVFSFSASFAANAQTFSAVPYVFANGQIYNPSQVMADFQAVVNSGNSVAVAINNAIGGLVSFPSGALEFFNLSSCPTGWVDISEVPFPGYYFIRGLDNGAGVDPGNTLAEFEPSTLQDHTHSYATGGLASDVVTGMETGGSPTQPFATGATFTSPSSTGTMIGGNPGSDTYPANVLLLLCGKT